MIEFYKSVEGQILAVDKIEPDVWINLTKPTNEEISTVVNELGVDEEFVRAALDEEETSRIEQEDGKTIIVVDVPYASTEDKLVTYSTIPLSIILTERNIVTVCLKETTVINEITEGRIKQIHLNMKTRFVLQVLYKIAIRFLQYLKLIDKISNRVEKQLHISMKNKELIQLLDLEKSLVFFSTSLKANEITMKKIARGRLIKLYEEDEDLLEDVIIETNQAIEMSNIYASILSGTMDAFASIISNNLNIVMKVLTVITILMAIPTMIASFYGMNVGGMPIPLFWPVIGIAFGITAVIGTILYKLKMF